MPSSILVECHPCENFSLENNQGRIIHAMLLRYLQEIEPELSEKLHSEANLKSFTTSFIIVNNFSKQESCQNEGIIQKGSLCKLRFTFLDDIIFQMVMTKFLYKDNFIIQKILFEIENVFVIPGSNIWAGYESYSDLFEKSSKTEREIRFKFVSPTTFRIGDADMPLPIPRLVFGSYLKKWNIYARDFPLPEDLTEKTDEFVHISYHNIRSESIKDNRSRQTGFIGDVNFFISAKADALFIKAVNVLSNYAFYAGTGRKTTMGMGQTIKR